MTPTTNQIKEALRILAQRKGRPDYELCTAKAVKRAMSLLGMCVSLADNHALTLLKEAVSDCKKEMKEQSQ